MIKEQSMGAYSFLLWRAKPVHQWTQTICTTDFSLCAFIQVDCGSISPDLGQPIPRASYGCGSQLFYRPPRQAACLVPRLLSAWVKRTHLPVQCCIPLMEINLILVTTSLVPPLQTHFVQVTKALWPPASLKQMVTGTCLSSTAADAWLSHPCSSTGPHTTPQARNTSPSPDFIAGDGAAPTGPAAGWGWGDIFPHWEG